MSFEEYLGSKKIDSNAFQCAEPQKWQNLKFVFDQVHPDSFTAQKLYLINKIRRAFPFKAMDQIEVPQKKKMRPVPKIITKTKPPKN